MQINQDIKSLQASFDNPTLIYLDENCWEETNSVLNNIPINSWLLLSDQNIYNACANNLFSKISNYNANVTVKIITPTRNITENLITSITETIKSNNCKFIIACGSGIINDLAKISAFQNNLDYAIFASAPSMNGYLSTTATICENNLHISAPAKPPKIAVFDLTILRNAPFRLIQSGFADSLGFYTTNIDWLAAHLLLDDQSYDNETCQILKKHTDKLSSSSKDLKNRKSKAIQTLTEHLIISGLAMRKSGSSKPASQGEHMIAHYYNDHSKIDSKQFHGEDIALTSTYMNKLQNKILNLNNIEIDNAKLLELENLNQFTKFSKEKLKLLEEKLSSWPEIANTIKKQENDLNAFAELGIKDKVDKSNWDQELFNEATQNSYKTRDRFTFLDLDFLIKNT